MQPNFNQHLNYAQQKVGFLTSFLNPILNMLDDRKFFGLPLRIFYYVIAIANLLIPLGVLVFCGYLFSLARYFVSWAWITVPIFCLIILIFSLIIGLGSFAFWVRRLQDIMAYNRQFRNYMSLRNFALMQRTFGEWIGLVTMFIGVVDFLTFLIPSKILINIGLGFIANSVIVTIIESIGLIVFGYFEIFVAKFIYDWLESFANNAADTRDLADIERMKIEIEDYNG